MWFYGHEGVLVLLLIVHRNSDTKVPATDVIFCVLLLQQVHCKFASFSYHCKEYHVF